jgi:hypothetical protein
MASSLGKEPRFLVTFISVMFNDSMALVGQPRFHDLRHSWKTNARRSGIDFEIREAILGHPNRKLDFSERYGFIDDYELIAAIDKFTYYNGSTQILVACNA